MSKPFQEELTELNNEIRKMGTLAEEAVAKSIAALKNRDIKAAQAVIDGDTQVDELELVIDERCLDLIARFQPMAVDVRFITTGMRLNGELERIADIAVDQKENCFPMIPSGAAHNEMILGAEHASQGASVTDGGLALV